MPRAARTVVAGVAHHVTQRGNRRENVFFHDLDRLKYLDLLRGYAEQYSLEVLGYCLMTNHVHLVVIPRTEASLAAVLGPVHLRYAQHVNRTQKLTGRLWQGRYFSCPLDDVHCLAALRYVERNPVRAGLVSRAEEYAWSSAASHAGIRDDPLVAGGHEILKQIADWTEWLAEDSPEGEVTQLRKHTNSGCPLGSPSFVADLELKCRRILHARPWGRPRKPQPSPSEEVSPGK